MKRIFTIILVSLLFAQPAFAALVGSTPAILDQDTSIDPIVWNHTVAEGENLLIVACFITDTENAFTIAAFTFNGDAMTEEATVMAGTASQAFLYYRVNPDVGTFQISIDFTGTDTNDGGCWSRSYSGANTSDPLTGTVTISASQGSISQAVTCAAGNEAVDIGGYNFTPETVVAGGSQTEIINGNDGTGDNFGSYQAGGASVTMGWTWDSSVHLIAYIATCVNAAAETATFGPLRRRM